MKLCLRDYRDNWYKWSSVRVQRGQELPKATSFRWNLQDRCWCHLLKDQNPLPYDVIGFQIGIPMLIQSMLLYMAFRMLRLIGGTSNREAHTAIIYNPFIRPIYNLKRSPQCMWVFAQNKPRCRREVRCA